MLPSIRLLTLVATPAVPALPGGAIVGVRVDEIRAEVLDGRSGGTADLDALLINDLEAGEDGSQNMMNYNFVPSNYGGQTDPTGRNAVWNMVPFYNNYTVGNVGQVVSVQLRCDDEGKILNSSPVQIITCQEHSLMS